jgi:hypothetical protein
MPSPSPVTGARPCNPILPQAGAGSKSYSTILEDFSVLAPSGNRLYGLIRRPDPAQYPDNCWAAIVLVPGGINPGRTAAYGEEAKLLAAAGMVVVTFNAEGRQDERSADDPRSEGSEDYNGYRNQDGLCAVVQYVMGLDYVIAENVGIASQSYGITMAPVAPVAIPKSPSNTSWTERGRPTVL